jgi:hypothetical protein
MPGKITVLWDVTLYSFTGTDVSENLLPQSADSLLSDGTQTTQHHIPENSNPDIHLKFHPEESVPAKIPTCPLSHTSRTGYH